MKVIREDSVVVQMRAPADVNRAAKTLKMKPLEYMLTVMNDETAEAARRDRMAMAAAPFVHAKAEAATPGKKEQAAIAATTAEKGTSWAGLLQ